MYSICSTIYNALKMNFDWEITIQNWVSFLEDSGEIVLVINKSEDDTFGAITRYIDKIKQNSLVKFKIIDADIPYSRATFDGELKNLAYKNASQPFVIQIDADEVIPLWSIPNWKKFALELDQRQEDAFFVPVVDLFYDEDHYKNVGTKWYLLKNKPYIGRGVVNFAKNENGTINTDRSDTCEAIILETGELIKAAHILNPGLPDFIKIRSLDSNPVIFHRGYLNIEYRKKINKFWLPVWSNRAGEEVTNIPLTDEDFKKIPYFKHNLPHWNQK